MAGAVEIKETRSSRLRTAKMAEKCQGEKGKSAEDKRRLHGLAGANSSMCFILCYRNIGQALVLANGESEPFSGTVLRDPDHADLLSTPGCINPVVLTGSTSAVKPLTLRTFR